MRDHRRRMARPQARCPTGDTTRPTADRTRETLFSMLASRRAALKAEAPTSSPDRAHWGSRRCRAARHCLFVDDDAGAIRAIRQSSAAGRGGTRRCPRRLGLWRSARRASRSTSCCSIRPTTGAGSVAPKSWSASAGSAPPPGSASKPHTTRWSRSRASRAVAERKVGKARLHLLRLPA